MNRAAVVLKELRDLLMVVLIYYYYPFFFVADNPKTWQDRVNTKRLAKAPPTIIFILASAPHPATHPRQPPEKERFKNSNLCIHFVYFTTCKV